MKGKKVIMTQLVTILFWVIAASAQQTKEQPSLNDAKVAIAKSNAIYFDAFVKGDSSLFIDRYAPGCCIMPQNTPSLCDTNAASDFFKLAYTQLGVRNGRFTTIELYGDGKEFVTESGLFELYDINNNKIENGKYLVLWKKTANGWKMFRDSFSSNNPLK